MSNNGKYSKLAKNSIIFAIANFGSNVLRFLIVPFYTYFMTNVEYGTVDTLTTTISLVMPLMLLAIQEAVLRFTLNKHKNAVSVLKNGLFVMLIGSIIFLTGYFPFSLIKVFQGFWWLFYFLLLANSINNILLNYARGTGKSLTFMFGGLINTFVMLICNVFLIAVLKKGAEGYILSMISGFVISSLFLLVVIKPHSIWNSGKVDTELLKEMMHYSIPLIPTAAMWWIMNVADKYSIIYFLGMSFAGVYAISHKVPTVVSMCYAIFQQAWQISAVDESEADDRSKFYENIYDYFFRTLFIVSSLIILIIKPLIAHIVETSFVDSWRYAPVLVISAVFSSMAGFLGVNYVVSQKTLGALTTSAFGAVVNILLNIIMIPFLKIQWAAIATLIGFYSVWLVRATISTAGIQIRQDYLAIHTLLGLELIQTVILVYEVPYQYLFQAALCSMVLLINRGVIVKSFRRFKMIMYRMNKENKKSTIIE